MVENSKDSAGSGAEEQEPYASNGVPKRKTSPLVVGLSVGLGFALLLAFGALGGFVQFGDGNQSTAASVTETSDESRDDCYDPGLYIELDKDLAAALGGMNAMVRPALDSGDSAVLGQAMSDMSVMYAPRLKAMGERWGGIRYCSARVNELNLDMEDHLLSLSRVLSNYEH